MFRLADAPRVLAVASRSFRVAVLLTPAVRPEGMRSLPQTEEAWTLGAATSTLATRRALQVDTAGFLDPVFPAFAGRKDSNRSAVSG